LTDAATAMSVAHSRYGIINRQCAVFPITPRWISGESGLIPVANHSRDNSHNLTSRTSIYSEKMTRWIWSSTTKKTPVFVHPHLQYDTRWKYSNFWCECFETAFSLQRSLWSMLFIY